MQRSESESHDRIIIVLLSYIISSDKRTQVVYGMCNEFRKVKQS